MAEFSNAATLTATNTNDSGAGSLRQTIANANDDIVFDASLAGQTIVLNSGEILIDKNLTITGPNPGLITISGNNNSRIINADSGVGPGIINVDIFNVNFINRDGAEGGSPARTPEGTDC